MNMSGTNEPDATTAVAREDLLWQHSPVREYLLKCFDLQVIPVECSTTIGPRAVYDLIKGDSVMKDVEYDDDFVR
mgnify:CR=1 FL=1